MMLRQKGRLLGGGLVFSLIAILAITAVAAAVPAGGVEGNAVVKVQAVRVSSSTFIHQSTGWVDVPGTSTTIHLDHKALILARFSGESSCNDNPVGSSNAGFCQVRIMIGGMEAQPAVGTNFDWDENLAGTGAAPHHAASMDRSRGVLAGDVPVVVQYRTSNARTSIGLDDYSLTIEAANLP